MEGIPGATLGTDVAADFFTVEVWTRRGLQRFIVLFFIELWTRKVEIAGVAANANGLWMEPDRQESDRCWIHSGMTGPVEWRPRLGGMLKY
jgi:hypothetical protein